MFELKKDLRKDFEIDVCYNYFIFGKIQKISFLFKIKENSYTKLDNYIMCGEKTYYQIKEKIFVISFSGKEFIKKVKKEQFDLKDYTYMILEKKLGKLPILICEYFIYKNKVLILSENFDCLCRLYYIDTTLRNVEKLFSKTYLRKNHLFYFTKKTLNFTKKKLFTIKKRKIYTKFSLKIFNLFEEKEKDFVLNFILCLKKTLKIKLPKYLLEKVLQFFFYFV